MVDRIGSGGALQREALLAALRRQAEATGEVQGAAGATGGPDFAKALGEGLRDVENQIQAAERLPQDMVAGGVSDFHEVAARIKSADLSFKFALEIRNKLIDAYREVMRMQV